MMRRMSRPPVREDRTRVALVAAAVGIAVLAMLAGPALPDGLWWPLRGQRLLAAAGVGALLALSGLAMQVVLRNPLADPYVLGTSGGAAVGALSALLLGLSLWWGAGLGALASSAVLLLLARPALAAVDEASSRLILVGAMLAALCGAASTLLLTLTPDAQLRGAVFWLVGDLSGADDRGLCLGLAVLLAVLLALRARSVDRLMLGSEAAAVLGEPVRALRAALLVAGALAAACAVAVAGAIGFVGLVVPHALRLAGVERTADQAWMAPLGGAALLVAADWLARSVAPPLELPVGAVMALVGAPVFIGFLIQEGRR
ncbi:MAG: iron chelate uptake ABC transporter family permease subunit [Burkholderiales bacterium]|nr:iron chelate uptake ABC transporter family permease subunit [Burkholderiales bacterium]